jgi:ZIP family zinc transporter
VAGAFGWGFLAASSLIVGGLLAIWFRIGERPLGLVMAFGSGVLISAVAYELVLDAVDTSAGGEGVALGLLAGALTFYAGDSAIGRMGGANRKRSEGAGEESSGLAITLGIVLDGIPESIVIGLTLIGGGGVSIAVLAAVFLSNLPEAMAATTGLGKGGWSRERILGLWVVLAIVSGLAAMAGFGIFDSASATSIAFVEAFAAGAILTMLADTMMPEAFKHGGKLVGLFTTLGFLVAFALSALE